MFNWGTVAADVMHDASLLSPTQLRSDLELARTKLLEFDTRIVQLEAVLQQLRPAIIEVASLIPVSALPGGELPVALKALMLVLSTTPEPLK